MAASPSRRGRASAVWPLFASAILALASRSLADSPLKTQPSASAPTFEAYPATPDFDKMVLPPFNGAFRTRTREGFKTGPRFAGHYVLFGIGCGAGCVRYTLGDLKTGKTSQFPIDGEDYPYLDLVFKPTSRLVRAQWEDHSAGLDDVVCVHQDFIWNGKAFDVLGATRVAGECKAADGAQ